MGKRLRSTEGLHKGIEEEIIKYFNDSKNIFFCRCIALSLKISHLFPYGLYFSNGCKFSYHSKLSQVLNQTLSQPKPSHSSLSNCFPRVEISNTRKYHMSRLLQATERLERILLLNLWGNSDKTLNTEALPFYPDHQTVKNVMGPMASSIPCPGERF